MLGGKPKIGDLNAPVFVTHDVVELEIGMGDIFGVQVFNGL